MSLITEHNHVVKRCLLLLLAGAESSDGLVNRFVSHQQTKYFLKTFRVALRIGFNLDKIIINVVSHLFLINLMTHDCDNRLIPICDPCYICVVVEERLK